MNILIRCLYFCSGRARILTLNVDSDTNDLEFAVHGGVTSTVHRQVNGQTTVDGFQCVVESDVEATIAISVNVQNAHVDVVSVAGFQIILVASVDKNY